MKKHKFHSHKIPILINDVNFDKMLISNKISFGKNGFKYLICYKNE